MPSYLEFCSLENVKMPARIEIKTSPTIQQDNIRCE